MNLDYIMLCERCYYKEYIDCDMKLLKHANLLETNLTSILWEKDARTVKWIHTFSLGCWQFWNKKMMSNCRPYKYTQNVAFALNMNFITYKLYFNKCRVEGQLKIRWKLFSLCKAICLTIIRLLWTKLLSVNKSDKFHRSINYQMPPHLSRNYIF